jgi:hypothetical protein
VANASSSKPKGWDIWKDGVSQSFLHVWLACREQARLKFKELWSSRRASLPLEFGNCGHWCLADMYRVGRPPTTKEIKASVYAYQHLWEKLVPNPSERQLEVQEEVYGMAEAVLPFYFKRWAGDFPGQKYPFKKPIIVPKKWLALEQPFDVPWTFTDGKVCRIRGIWDGLFADKVDDEWLFETKTKSVIDEEGIQDTLPLDIQVMLYCWALLQDRRNPPAGVLYNVVRRPGLYRRKGEALPEFLGRVREDIPARPDHYFMRWKMRLMPKELAQWVKRTLGPMLDDVRAWAEGRAPHYMNPDSLITKYGRCDMFEPIVRGEFGDCYQRKTAFNEIDAGI